jgi:hypothetical protein
MPIAVFTTHNAVLVTLVPYKFQKVVKCRMDDCLNNVKVDLAVSDVLGGMKFIRELHCLHITKEASNAECNLINREVSTRSLLQWVRDIWAALQPPPNRLVAARVECLWKPCSSP